MPENLPDMPENLPDMPEKLPDMPENLPDICPEMVGATAAPNPPSTRAGGQDDGSLQTP